MDWSEYVYYDETSPTFLRRKIESRCGLNGCTVAAQKDSVAGGKRGHGYYVVSINNRSYNVHRIIWELHRGRIPDGCEIDHLNRNRLDNKITNLRLVTRQINCQNHTMRNDNTSGVTGVYLTKNKTTTYWSANYSYNGKVTKKHFSINKLGFEEAKRQAIACRELMIRTLNSSGLNYTETHGEK